MRDIIHFSHANGFPAPVYRQLFAELSPDYDMGYLDMIGHDPRYPVTDSWPHLVEETLHTLQARYTQPVIGVGHSLGGVITLLAALRRPQAFRAVVLLDAPLFNPWRGRLIWLGKLLGQTERITPAGAALRRRAHWPDADSAVRHFAGKALFAEFSPQALRDYIEHGADASEHGVRLRFQPQIEGRIFATLPHSFAAYRGRLAVPGAYVACSRHEVMRPSDVRFACRRFGLKLYEHPGRHLFPLERPRETAAQLRQIIGELNAKVGAG